MIVFNNINAARNLRIKWNSFLGQFFKNTGCLVLIMLLFEIIKIPFTLDSWKGFVLGVGVAAIIGYIVSFIVLFPRDEKRNIIKLINSKIRHKNKIKGEK